MTPEFDSFVAVTGLAVPSVAPKTSLVKFLGGMLAQHCSAVLYIKTLICKKL
jgi:hypothetical protein